MRDAAVFVSLSSPDNQRDRGAAFIRGSFKELSDDVADASLGPVAQVVRAHP